MKFRLRYTLFVEILRFLKFFLGDFCESSNSRRQSHKVYRSRAFSRKMLIWLGLKFDEELKLYCDMMMCILIKCISTKENAYYLNLFAYRTEVVTVLYARQLNSLDAILDRPATFCLNLMFLVFLTRELLSILWHSFAHRWNVGNFLFTTGLLTVFLAVFN